MSQLLSDIDKGFEKEHDISALIKTLWRRKLFIFFTSALFSIIGIFYALSLPDVYSSEALLTPVSESSGLQIPGQLGGLAALAGVNVGSLSGDGKTDVALAILKSRDFLTRFIERHDLLIPLMAAKQWDRSSNSIVIDEKIYDDKNDKWVREVNPPYVSKPSLLEAYQALDEILDVKTDQLTNLTTVRVTHVSPTTAQQIVNNLIKDLNSEMREQERSEATHSINYLNDQLKNTILSEVKTMLYSLIEEQTKALMLTNVREEYIFKIIDPAIIEEEKSGPKRAFIVILFTLLGGFLSTAFVLFSNRN